MSLPVYAPISYRIHSMNFETSAKTIDFFSEPSSKLSPAAKTPTRFHFPPDPGISVNFPANSRFAGFPVDVRRRQTTGPPESKLPASVESLWNPGERDKRRR